MLLEDLGDLLWIDLDLLDHDLLQTRVTEGENDVKLKGKRT